MSVHQVDLFNPDGQLVGDLIDVFDTDDSGAVVARDAPSLMKTLGRDGKGVTIRVMAGDVAGFGHVGKVTFRIR